MDDFLLLIHFFTYAYVCVYACDRSYSTSCTWYISPEVNPDSSIYVKVDEFRTVLGEDALFFLDSDTSNTFVGADSVVQYGNPLAVLSGIVPVPHVMRFNADELRVQFITYGNDFKDTGFSFTWWTDGSTCEQLDGCNGNGECVDGLCECAEGYSGGDCSLAVPDLPLDGSVVSGELAIGETNYFRVTVPDDGEKYFLRVDMKSLGGPGADPLLMIANATASPNWMRDYYFLAPQGSESIGTCGEYPGCHWCASCSNGYDEPGVSDLLTIAGPVTDYSHTSYGMDDAYPDPVDTRLMSLPTQHFNTFSDYESWDLRKPLHTIYLSNEVTDKTQLPPGDWIVGVYNALPSTLVDFGEDRFWGTDPGFDGATASAPYELSAVLSTNLNDMCSLGCSGNGDCLMNECICDMNSDVHYSGSACEIPAAVIPVDVTLNAEPLPLGEWAYFFVPLNVEDIGKSIFAEISFAGSPDTLPFLFLNKASNGVPTENVLCGNFWGSGPYGATHCEILGYDADGEAIDDPLVTSGVDYHHATLEPEANVISDGQLEEGFYVGVYNHPGHGDSELIYQLQVRFIDTADPQVPCPFNCSDRGTCSPPVNDMSAVGVCECDEGFAGAYCDDEASTIAIGDKIEDVLPSGDWRYFRFVPPTTAPVLVSLSKDAENIAKPFLFVKEGGFPTLSSTFASTISTVEIALDAGTNGISFDQYTSSVEPGYEGNVLFDLSGIPGGSKIIGLAFNNLTVTTVGTSYVNEACLVFFTGPTSFSAPLCLDEYNAPAPEGYFLDGQGPLVSVPIVAPDDGTFFMELGENPYANDNKDGAPDAFLNGTLIVQYIEELARGFDYEDPTSIFCNGGDCAVDDFHDVLVDAEEGKSYYIGVLNARHITQTPHIDSGAAVGTQERFRGELEYSLDLRTGDDALNIPCYRDCSGRGECVETLAPICSCEPGFFGLACEISPAPLPVASSADSTEQLSGSVPEGRFNYYRLDLPEDAVSLVVTMTSPRGVERSSPSMWIKQGGLPRFCESIQGIELDTCTNDYDFGVDEFSLRLSTLDERVYQMVITPETNTTLENEKFGNSVGNEPWYLSVHNDLDGRDDLTYTLEAFQTNDIQCKQLDCSGNGICDSSVGLCKCVETDGLKYARDDCSAPIYVATEGETLKLSQPIPPGQAAFIEVNINCLGQDLIMESIRPLSNSGAEYEIIMPTAPGIDPTFEAPLIVGWESGINEYFRTYYAFYPSSSGIVPWGEAIINNIPPGTYTVGIFNFFESTMDLVDLEFTYSVRGSLAPNAFNECPLANEQLALGITAGDGTPIAVYTGPASGSTRDGDEAYDLFEANFIGDGTYCGTADKSCLFASNHTTSPSDSYGRVSSVGHGNIAAKLAFGISQPTAANADYYYTTDSVNKIPGLAPPDLETVLFQATIGGISYDFEGCTPLINPQDVAGNICVLVRGGCTFSLKTIHCQNAGAVGVLVINSRVGEPAITMAGSYVGETFLIPAAMVSNRAGTTIYQAMIAEDESLSSGSMPPGFGVGIFSFNAMSNVSGIFNVAKCEAPATCPACANGRFSEAGVDVVDQTCDAFSCPGVSAAGDSFFSGLSDLYNCTGNGIDDGFGGCSVSATGAVCTCAPGFIGEGCELPSTPECPIECTACQNCVRSYCFTLDCPFCADELDTLGVGFEDGMLAGCDSEVCAACVGEE